MFVAESENPQSIPEDKLKELRDTFDFFDIDHNGKLDQTEVFRTMRGLGYQTTKKEVKRLFQEVDINKDGDIDFSEFCKFFYHSEEDATLKGLVNPLEKQYAESGFRHTKIVCTLGPGCDDETVLENLIKEGLDAARFNFSHGSYEEHKVRIERFKKICKKLGRQIPMILDTKGPEIRLGTLKGKVLLKKGQEYTLTTKKGIEGDDKIASVSHKRFARDLKVGDKVLIDDGLVELVVIEKDEVEVKCKVLNEGTISSNKGVNLPGVKTSLPSLTEKDMNDLEFGVQNGFDFVAASFITCREDVIVIRNTLDICGGEEVKIISKIENQTGLDNFNDILDVSDGIMVARGDLGVEIPVEQIPTVQKYMIAEALKKRKIVITATQMLDSMINNPRPTRAETSDITNAVIQGTGCCMLSGETAAGKYPEKAVDVMSKVIKEAETNLNILDFDEIFEEYHNSDIDKDDKLGLYLTQGFTAIAMHAKAIVIVCKTDKGPILLSSCRPPQPVYAITISEEVARKINILWGCTAILVDAKTNDPYNVKLEKGIEQLLSKGFIKKGDTIVLGGGTNHLLDKDGVKVGGIMIV